MWIDVPHSIPRQVGSLAQGTLCYTVYYHNSQPLARASPAFFTFFAPKKPEMQIAPPVLFFKIWLKMVVQAHGVQELLVLLQIVGRQHLQILHLPLYFPALGKCFIERPVQPNQRQRPGCLLQNGIFPSQILYSRKSCLP